jgi:hypothetical protein
MLLRMRALCRLRRTLILYKLPFLWRMRRRSIIRTKMLTLRMRGCIIKLVRIIPSVVHSVRKKMEFLQPCGLHALLRMRNLHVCACAVFSRLALRTLTVTTGVYPPLIVNSDRNGDCACAVAIFCACAVVIHFFLVCFRWH